MTVDVGGLEVSVGGTAVAEGVKVNMGVGCAGSEQATSRRRMPVTAWEQIFFMIAPPYLI
jgi:hypothetical protein